MTGEITLRGRVLPIGGLKEKILAAHRSGIKTIIIPSENKSDLEDIPAKIKKEVRLIPVLNIDKILSLPEVFPKKNIADRLMVSLQEKSGDLNTGQETISA